MKNKILILIIGILIGAIITTSGFLIYNKVFLKNPKIQETTQMKRNEQNGKSLNGNMEESPLMPNGRTPQEKSVNSNNNNNV